MSNIYHALVTNVDVTMKLLDELRRRSGVPYFHIMAKQPAWFALFDQVMETRPDVEEKHDGYTPLEIAIKHRNLDLARRLVHAGASPCIPSRGISLIHVALAPGIHHGASSIYDVIKYVLELRPGDVNYASLMGRTPLQLALDRHLRFGVVQLLLEHGANPNVTYSSTSDPDRTNHSILHTIYDMDSPTESRRRVIRLVVAYGGRYTEAENSVRWPRRGDCIIAAVEQCRSVARAVLGLKKCQARVHGNGRDVLRLIAKRVWLSRMDEGWC